MKPPRCLLVALTVLTTALSALPAQTLAPSPSKPEKSRPAAAYLDPQLPTEARCADLLARMTLEEKVGQLQLRNSGSTLSTEEANVIRAGGAGIYMVQQEGAAQSNQLQRIAVNESRLGIPVVVPADVIHGYRTTFPISLGLSCAWSPDLFEQMQAVAAREARAAGTHWAFAPMSEVARDPRWGRVAETCGEDPYLAARCVEAEVRGFQGGDVGAGDRIAACLKHFVGYSASVGGRDYNETQIPELSLRNIFLPPFHSGVRAGAWTIMTAFNANDGIPCTANPHLLTGILRGEWGFQGAVISDAGSVGETVNWGFAADQEQAARLCLEAGTDVELGAGAYPSLVAQVRQGRVSIETIDDAARRVLRLKFALGLFEHPYTDESAYLRTVRQPDALALARECAARSCVLLTNRDNTVLPLDKTRLHKVALIGPFADNQAEMLGSWASVGHPDDVITLAAGLRASLPKETALQVVKGCDVQSDALQAEEAVNAARDADAVVMALGESRDFSGENACRTALGVTGRQQELFDAVAATGKPVIVVVFCGRVLALPEIIEKAAAVLVAWQPGVEGGNGLSDVLLGNTAPSGKLTMSWPRAVGQLPVYYNGYTTGRPTPQNTAYKDLTSAPRFPFGHGLTYTTFTYAKPQAARGEHREPDTVSAVVTNTGQRAGSEAVQLYIRQLACSEGARPRQELRGFARVALEPGEQRRVTFRLSPEVLGYWDRSGKFRTDAGRYELWIAPEATAGEGLLYEAGFSQPAMR